MKKKTKTMQTAHHFHGEKLFLIIYINTISFRYTFILFVYFLYSTHRIYNKQFGKQKSLEKEIYKRSTTLKRRKLFYYLLFAIVVLTLYIIILIAIYATYFLRTINGFSFFRQFSFKTIIFSSLWQNKIR